MKLSSKTMVGRLGAVGGGGGYSREGGMGLNGILRRIAGNLPTVPPTPKQKKRPGSPQPLLTDDQVREVRRRSERENESRERLCTEFGLTREYLAKLLDYTVRSKVLP